MVEPQPVTATPEVLGKVLDSRPVLWVGAGASMAAGHPGTDRLEEAMAERFLTPLDTGQRFERVADAPGDMKNRIKEKQFDFLATRTSAHLMQVNQLRLWFASVAYLLISELRRLALAGTSNARLRCQTIRLRLLKVGARVRAPIAASRPTCRGRGRTANSSSTSTTASKASSPSPPDGGLRRWP